MSAKVIKIIHHQDKFQSNHKVGTVSAGKGVTFVDDVTDVDTLNLDAYFVKSPAEYLFKVVGKSMEPTVKDGAIVVVSKEIFPTDNSIIIVTVNDELMIKRIIYIDDYVILRSDNSEFPDIKLDSFSQNRIWGVVKTVHQEV